MQSTAPTSCIAVSPIARNSVSLRPLRIINFRTSVLISEGRLNHITFNSEGRNHRHSLNVSNQFSRRLPFHQKFISSITTAASGGGGSMSELNDDVRKLLQVSLWIAEAVYIIWLFLLPYAPVSTAFLFVSFLLFFFLMFSCLSIIYFFFSFYLNIS